MHSRDHFEVDVHHQRHLGVKEEEEEEHPLLAGRGGAVVQL